VQWSGLELFPRTPISLHENAGQEAYRGGGVRFPRGGIGFGGAVDRESRGVGGREHHGVRERPVGGGALEDYVEWLERSGLNSTIPRDSTAPDYDWHYVTNTVPGSGRGPGIVIDDVSSGDFTVSDVPEFRYYQLVYTTDFSLPLASYTPVNLGWGEYVGTVPFPVDGDWYGGIRVLLDEPTEP
jgi:hypothetical protein